MNTMNNRLVESTKWSHIRVNMQRIGILTKTIDETLIRVSFNFELSIMIFLRSWRHRVRFSITFKSKTSNSSNKITTINIINQIFFTLPNLIKILSYNNNPIFTFILKIQYLKFTLIFSIEWYTLFHHVQLLLTMK